MSVLRGKYQRLSPDFGDGLGSSSPEVHEELAEASKKSAWGNFAVCLGATRRSVLIVTLSALIREGERFSPNSEWLSSRLNIPSCGVAWFRGDSGFAHSPFSLARDLGLVDKLRQCGSLQNAWASSTSPLQLGFAARAGSIVHT